MDKNKREKLSLLSKLVKLANADKTLREPEMIFLKSISEQLGIPDEDFQNIFDSYIEFTPPKLEFNRILQFQRLILLMHIDLNVDENEIHHIQDIGMRMGLSPSAITTVLNEMDNYPNKIIPPQRLIEIFKIYHN